MEWAEVATHLADAGLAHVATATADGRPHASVVAAVVDGDGLAFFTLRTSGKARNLAANPHIALMWQPRGEIYVSGDVEISTDVTEKARLWDSGLLPYDPVGFFQSPDNPELVLVRVHPTRATVVTMGPDGLQRLVFRRAADG